MATRNIHIKLTPLFLVWSIVFVAVAFVSDDWSWLWWAAAPWIGLVAFTAVFTAVMALVIWVMYMRGYPVTLETPRKGKRIVQRGRSPRPVQ